jgi:transposase
MTATRKQHSTKRTEARGILYLAFDLGWSEWKLAFATGPADNPRVRSVGGRNTAALLVEIAKAKERFGLPEDAPVHSCYEAGRDGFWLHRFLENQGIVNLVVDSSSIDVKRRGRRRKTDRLDVGKLLRAPGSM